MILGFKGLKGNQVSNELALIKAQVQPNENTLKGNKNMEGWGGGGGGGEGR